jgi:hypothetical protein
VEKKCPFELMGIQCDIALMNSTVLTTEPPAGELHPLTIRFATETDEPAVIRVAALDSAPVPAGLLLLAEERGELRAALSATDGRVVADPFRRTAHLVEMLRAACRATARSVRA